MTKIVVVGEAWGMHENRLKKPFQGASGNLLRRTLKGAGIDEEQCLFTNVFNFQPEKNNLDTLCGPKKESIPDFPMIRSSKYVRAEFASEIERLEAEIAEAKPNLIIALGAIACWALFKKASIRDVRGAPAMSRLGVKVLPTYHPAALLREAKMRPYFWADILKAAKEAEFPEVRRPERELWLEPRLADLTMFEHKHLSKMPVVSIDIETRSGQITCIGFGDTHHAIVIPFVLANGNSYWPTVEHEITAWKTVRRWLGDFQCNGKPQVKIGQNFSYDYGFLYEAMALPVKNIGDDTMLMHHAYQIEMDKDLGTLGSLYTNEPSWKNLGYRGTKNKQDG